MEEDECLPVGILEEYKNYELSPDDVAHIYNCLQHGVNEFTLRGDGETFYPFNCVQRSECLFPRLSKDASLFLGFDLANHLVAFLSHGYFHTKTGGFQRTFSDILAVEFTQKEKAIICYLGGYVFATLSRRIRNSKNWNSKLIQDNLKILIAGEALNDHDDLTFVNIKDRGGLWKVRPEVCKIFSVAQPLYFNLIFAPKTHIIILFIKKYFSTQISPLCCHGYQLKMADTRYYSIWRQRYLEKKTYTHYRTWQILLQASILLDDRWVFLMAFSSTGLSNTQREAKTGCQFFKMEIYCCIMNNHY